jgi:UDP-N-acetylmuramate: L-alanyl-gamma-D-glutamyl-meso-diaminopimelate ligase
MVSRKNKAGFRWYHFGMHARIDNPELIQSKALNIPVFSFPEFIYNQSKDKKRVVISGSHGKTTITSMILHVLKFHQKDFDYLVGAQIEGFDLMVKISDAPVIIIEGDEYLTSPH